MNYYELAVFLPREDGLYEKAEEVHCQKAYPREEIEELIREAGMEASRCIRCLHRQSGIRGERAVILHRKRKRQSKIRNEVNS